MTRTELVQTLTEDLKVKKEIIAVKALKAPPAHIPPYPGQASPGMCALGGEIIENGSLWYVTKENLGCPMALTATGTCEDLSREQFLEYMIGQNRDYPMHQDPPTLVSYYDRVDGFFTYPKVEGTGMVVGSLLKVEAPDLVLLFVTPHQADILTRARAFLGDFTRGFGGMGGCIFTLRYSFVLDDPCFSTSDTAWRMFAGLDECELTYTFPYPKLLEIAPQIKPTAEYVNGFKSMF